MFLCAGFLFVADPEIDFLFREGRVGLGTILCGRLDAFYVHCKKKYIHSTLG